MVGSNGVRPPAERSTGASLGNDRIDPDRALARPGTCPTTFLAFDVGASAVVELQELAGSGAEAEEPYRTIASEGSCLLPFVRSVLGGPDRPRTMHDRKHDTDRSTNRPRTDAYTRTRRDASAGWRDEYALQGVDDTHEPRADGGRYILPSEGSRVRDRDEEDDEELLVVRVREDTRADDHRIDALDATVADVNPEYDPDAPVVEAVYVDELESLDGRRTVEGVRDAVADGDVGSYSFPADRLAAISGGERA